MTKIFLCSLIWLPTLFAMEKESEEKWNSMWSSMTAFETHVHALAQELFSQKIGETKKDTIAFIKLDNLKIGPGCDASKDLLLECHPVKGWAIRYVLGKWTFAKTAIKGNGENALLKKLEADGVIKFEKSEPRMLQFAKQNVPIMGEAIRLYRINTQNIPENQQPSTHDSNHNELS